MHHTIQPYKQQLKQGHCFCLFHRINMNRLPERQTARSQQYHQRPTLEAWQTKDWAPGQRVREAAGASQDQQIYRF